MMEKYGLTYFGIAVYHTHRSTFSFVHERTGTQIALVTGTRRMMALRAHLAGLSWNTWGEWRDAAEAWMDANPRAGLGV